MPDVHDRIRQQHWRRVRDRPENPHDTTQPLTVAVRAVTRSLRLIPEPIMPILHAEPWLSALALGGGLGLVGGLFGIGGGLLAIPVLGLWYGLDQAHAQGTALVMVLPNVLIGFQGYRRRHGIALRPALVLGVTAVAGTGPAAHFATTLPAATLRMVFAGFLVALAGWLLRGLRRPAATAVPAARLPARWLPAVGLAGGAMSGLFSVGGGIAAVPLLTGWFGTPQAVAQGLALALVTPGSAVALVAYARAGAVDWTLGLLLALGGVLTVPLGVALAHRLPERRLRALFALGIGATAGVLFASA